MDDLQNCGWIFVYGTLKTGCGNHSVIEEFVMGCEPVQLRGATMYDLGPFPGIVLNGEGVVKGELMYVHNIKEVIRRLDKLEGYRPHEPEYCHYMRRTVDVKSEVAGMVTAYTYEIVDRYDYANTKRVVEEWVPNEYWTHN